MTSAEIALGSFSLILTIAGGFLALRLRPLEDADNVADKRITDMHAEMKEDREKFEKRIMDIEKTYLSRAELTAAVKDLRDNFDKGVDRIELVMRALGAKVDNLAERVGRVEAAP